MSEDKTLTPMERFDWLRERHKEEYQKRLETGESNDIPIPWDRMATPPHTWFDKYNKIYNTDVEINIPKTTDELKYEYMIFRRILIMALNKTRKNYKIVNEDMFNKMLDVSAFVKDWMDGK